MAGSPQPGAARRRGRFCLADQVDRTRFAAGVAGVFAYYQGSAPLQPQAARPVVAELQRLFGQTVQFRPALWGQAATETQQLLTLTQEQHSVLDLLNRRRRAAICGCAGAGKTLLALVLSVCLVWTACVQR